MHWTDAIFKIKGVKNGTCFLIHDQQHVLTAYHNIEGANSATVFLERGGHTHEIEANLVETFSDRDIALLELTEPIPDDIAPLPLGSIHDALGKGFKTYGYPSNPDLGNSHQGGIMSEEASRHNHFEIYFDPAPPHQLRGLSGAPALGRDAEAPVVGVIIEHIRVNKGRGAVGGITPEIIDDIETRIEQGHHIFYPNVVECYVVASESEANNSSLDRAVRGALRRVKRDARCPQNLTVNEQPIMENIVDIVASRKNYQRAIRALCQADIVVFDLTNFEPAVMLLLGIRSVVRRGTTICSIGGSYKIGDVTNFPFNIKEVSFVSHSSDQFRVDAANFRPPALISERILEGLQQSHMSQYLDLPSFDAVRNLMPGHRDKFEIEDKDEAKRQILLLCSYGQRYQKDNWYFHSTGVSIHFSDLNPRLIRILDISSPRLVSKTIYEEIRRTGICLVDWTDWRANVFFEMGVRLACTVDGTINVIEDQDIDLLDVIAGDEEAALDFLEHERRLEDPEDDYERYLSIQNQCRGLLRLFNPLPYDSTQDESSIYSQIESVARYPNQVGTLAPGELAPNDTYHTIGEFINPSFETYANPVYLELLGSARFLLSDESEGISPVLFPQNSALTRSAKRGALDRLLAAWLYLEHVYKRDIEAIAQDPQLLNNYIEIGLALARVLREYEDPYALDVFEFTTELEDVRDDLS